MADNVKITISNNAPAVKVVAKKAETISGTTAQETTINFIATGERGATGATGASGATGITVTSVNASNIENSSISTSKIQNNAVTADKLEPSLKNKIDSIGTGAEVNVNADWNATSGDAEILNKPSIPTVPPLIDSDTMSGALSTNVASAESIKTYVDAEIAGIVDSAPTTLNTLNELAAALNDDDAFSTTVTNSIALKAPIASPTFTGTIAIPNIANVESAIAANTAKTTFPGFGTSAGTALEGDTTIPSYSAMGSGNSYAEGLVPAGSVLHTAKFLRKDGVWANPYVYMGMDGITFSTNQVSVDLKANGGLVIESGQIALDLGASSITNNLTIPPDLTSDGAGTVHANNYTNTTYDVMGSGNGYAAGLVKAGGVVHSGAFLRKDGSWAIPPDTTYSEATSSAEGLMSTAHHDKLDGIAAGATAYADADAVSAVAAADDYLKNDANDTMSGSLTLEGSLFVQRSDGGGTTKTKLVNNSTTGNKTLDVPDASGVLALTNSLIDTKTAAYWSSSTGGFYITLSGASTSENQSLTTSSYTLMYVVPFDGKIKRISSFHQSNVSGDTTLEVYVDGDDSDLTADQRGTDMTITSHTRKFTEDCPADWTFSKGEAIAIKRTDSVARYGVTMTIVFEYDTTT